MIALEQKQERDSRFLSEVCFFFTDEFTNIAFDESMQIILKAMFECIYSIFNIFQAPEEQPNAFI